MSLGTLAQKREDIAAAVVGWRCYLLLLLFPLFWAMSSGSFHCQHHVVLQPTTSSVRTTCHNGRPQGAPKHACHWKTGTATIACHTQQRRACVNATVTPTPTPPPPQRRRLLLFSTASPLSSSTPKQFLHTTTVPPSASTAPKRPCLHPLCATQHQAAVATTPMSGHANPAPTS